jgi:hypothetical protein
MHAEETAPLRPQQLQVGLVGWLQRQARSHRLLSLATLGWSLVLVAWMPFVWSRGVGAVPLAEDRVAIATLTVAAGALGYAIRRWVWPVLVGVLWIVLVGGTQVYLAWQIGGARYLERWRQVAPTRDETITFLFWTTSIWTWRFETSDLVCLVLAGAAFPVVGAFVGLALGHLRSAGADRLWWFALALCGNVFFGIVGGANYDLDTQVFVLLLVIPLMGVVSGAFAGRWAWFAAVPLATFVGVLLVVAWGLLARSISGEWRNVVFAHDAGTFADLLTRARLSVIPASVGAIIGVLLGKRV